jgi:ornithine cyclodeaminase/alanine dehydrogenase-like protein (mu-crystallin family)
MHHPACWCRTSDRHLAADLGRVGALMVWHDPSTGTWSAFVLGTQQTGFMTAAAAQAAAIRIAREQLEDGLRKLAELTVKDVTQSGLERTSNPASAPGRSERS